MPLADLDLDLALTRLERDYKYGRTFYVHPYEIQLVNRRRTEWLDGIRAVLSDGTFRPSTPIVANVPKGSHGVRPGAILSLQDQVVYTAAVGTALGSIFEALSWCDPPKDYAYQVRDRTGPDWLSVPFYCWNGFRERSVQLLENAPALVVTTDITGCYEHIDHDILASDLRGAGVPADVLALLSQCLGRWSALNGRGLPQNLAASHLLAKLYLTRVDHALHERGFTHVRYVDDIRIFCSNSDQSKLALLELTVLLRERGLTLQSAKTDVLLPGDARNKFLGIDPVLRPLARNFIREIAEQAGLDPAYMTVAEAEELVTSGTFTIPVAMLRAAYQAHFLAGSTEFDTTLFHFLLRRLGHAQDAFAVEHCLSVFEERPEETENVLAYFAKVGAVASTDEHLVAYLESDGGVYDYQAVQFLRWRVGLPVAAGDRVLAFSRGVATAGSSAPYFRSTARALLGRFGTESDLDGLLRSYGAAASDLDRAEIVCSTARVERGRRNAFLGRIRDDGFLTGTAVVAVKDGWNWYGE